MNLDGTDLAVTVTDNGTYKDVKGKGIGVESIKRRANSIKGELSYSLNENNGTSVQLNVFVKPNERSSSLL